MHFSILYEQETFSTPDVLFNPIRKSYFPIVEATGETTLWNEPERAEPESLPDCTVIPRNTGNQNRVESDIVLTFFS